MAYRGHIFPIPVGHRGLVGTRDQSQVPADALIIARNLSLESSLVRKEGGAVKYNATALTGTPSVIGGWDWWPVDGTQRAVVVTSAGDILKDTGGGTFSVTLASGLTVAGTVPMFVEGGKEVAANNRKLFILTGKNAVQVLAADGATTANLSTPPADWSGANQPSFGFIHAGRFMAGGNLNDPHRIYYSTTASHEDVAGGGSISVYPGEGEKLVAGVSFKGLIVLWKYPRGVYLIDTSDPTPSNWIVKAHSRKIGGVSPLGIAEVDNDIIFVDATGNFHLLSAVQEFGDTSSSNISRTNDIYSFIQGNMNLAQLSQVRAVYYDAKREAHFAMAGLGSTVNNTRFVIDFNRSDAFRFRVSDRDTCQSLWLRKDTTTLVPRLTSGDNAGFVWSMDQDTKSKDGVGYSGAFQTGQIDFSSVDPALATKRKIGDFLECIVQPTGNWDLTVQIYWDGVLVQTVTFNQGSEGAVLGAFILGTDALAGTQILNRKRRIIGSGRRFALAGSNSTAGQDFAVGSFFLHARVADERPGQDVD